MSEREVLYFCFPIISALSEGEACRCCSAHTHTAHSTTRLPLVWTSLKGKVSNLIHSARQDCVSANPAHPLCYIENLHHISLFFFHRLFFFFFSYRAVSFSGGFGGSIGVIWQRAPAEESFRSRGSGCAGRHSRGVQRRSAHGRAAGSNNKENKQQILCADCRGPSRSPTTLRRLIGDAVGAATVKVVLSVRLVLVIRLFFFLFNGAQTIARVRKPARLESIFMTIVISRSR